jgi:hypothetical protein
LPEVASQYEATRDLWQLDKVLIVRGKVDAESREPKILCESVQDYLVIARPVEEGRLYAARANETRTSYAPSTAPNPEPYSAPDSATDAASDAGGNGHEATNGELHARHLHITLRRTGDRQQDRQRASEVYALLQRHPGNDRFTLFVVHGGNRVQIDFPNATTRLTADLAQSLTAMLGRDAVQVM